MLKFKVICDAPGQTCNRLWSYLDTVSWAIKNDGKVYVINWDTDIKYFPNLLKSRYCSFPFYSQIFFKLFGENRWKHICAIISLNSFARKIRNIWIGKRLGFLNGWDLREKHEYYPYVKKSVLQDIFSPSQQIIQDVSSELDKYKSEGYFIVGVHMRGGDYRHWESGQYFFEKEEYRDFMFQIKTLFANEKVCFFISTNEKYDKSYFGEFILCELNKNTTAIHDLYTLSQCNRIIGPHSSFSRWASFIGDVPLCYIEHGGEIASDKDFSLIKDFYHFKDGRTIRI
mgnify:CR=1 FL=1